MEIVSAIVQMLGGLAMFLYGIEVMGDGLKNSSGAALKRVLEKVTGNVVMGVLTGTMVTAVIQSSTATIVLAVALIGAGVLTLKQAVSIVLGANIGTTITAWITTLAFIESGDNWLLWLFDTDTLAPIALFIGIVLIMFIKTAKTKTIGDICIGFGILFVGLMNMTGAVKRNLLIDGAEDNELKVVVRLEWETDDGIAYQDFVYGVEYISTICSGTYDLGFLMKNYESLGITPENLTVKGMVITNSGIEVSGIDW